MTSTVYPVGTQLTTLRTNNEITEWESWGKTADKIYDDLSNKIESGEISSESELTPFIETNAEYLQLEIEDDGESYINPTIDDRIKYFINKDRLYKIEDDLFKVYSNGTLKVSDRDLNKVSTSIAYSDINDPNFQSNNEIIISSRLDEGVGDPNDECGASKVGQTTTGNQRTKVYAKAKQTIGLNNQVFVQVDYEAKPFKKVFGSWHSVKRTFKGAWAAGLDYEDASGWHFLSDSYSYANVKDNHIKYTVIGHSYYWYGSGNPGFHLNGVSVWADTPSTSYADVECNEEWICVQEYCIPPFG